MPLQRKSTENIIMFSQDNISKWMMNDMQAQKCGSVFSRFNIISLSVNA